MDETEKEIYDRKIAAQTDKNQMDNKQEGLIRRRTKSGYLPYITHCISEGPRGWYIKDTICDEDGNIKQIVKSQKDGKYQVEETMYDENGNIIKQTVESRKDGKYQVEETTYDESGNIVKQTVKTGESTSIWYKKLKQKNN